MNRIGVVIIVGVLCAACGGSPSPAPPSVQSHPPASPAAPSAAASSSSPTPAPDPSKPKRFVVEASAFTISSGIGPNDYFVEWTAILHNPNLAYFGAFPEVNVTAYAGSKVVGSEQQTLNSFPPDINIDWSDQVETHAKPTRVKVVYSGVKWYPTKTAAVDYPPFATTGVSFNAAFDGSTVTGTVHNPYGRSFSQMALTALFYDHGKLDGGATDFLDHLHAHSSLPFSIDLLGQRSASPQKVVVMAQPWGGQPDVWNHAGLAMMSH